MNVAWRTQSKTQRQTTKRETSRSPQKYIDRMLDERESAPYHAADLNDETYVEFTTGYLAARKES